MVVLQFLVLFSWQNSCKFPEHYLDRYVTVLVTHLPKQSGVAKLDTNVSRRRTTAGAILLLRVARHYDDVANLEQEKMAYTVSVSFVFWTYL
jgi:hypothetical protein